MARRAGSSGEATFRAIREAAIERIARTGFAATTLRQIAADVGLQAASLYNHITSKQALLVILMTQTMDDLDAGLARALGDEQDPLLALNALIAFHIDFHTERRREVFIGNMELRSLEPEGYAAIVARRNAYEERLRDILTRGRDTGIWHIEDVRVTSYAVLAMLTGICNWYTPSGRLPRAELARLYANQILAGLKGMGMDA